MTAATRRRPNLLKRAFLVVLVLAVVGALLSAGAVATNAFGVGDKFETLVGRIERIIWPPPPDRATRPTVTVTPAPARSNPPATPPTTGEGGSPAPTGTPLARTPVDMTIADDPDAVFAHELRTDWCAPAGVQMTLATLGLGDTSEQFQRDMDTVRADLNKLRTVLEHRYGSAV